MNPTPQLARESPRRDPTAWWRWASLAVIPALLGVISLTRGLRWEYFAVCGLFAVLAWVGPRCRWLSFYLLPFVLTGLTYDHFGYLADWLRSDHIHVAELYEAELSLFGVSSSAGLITLPEFFSRHNHPVVDFITGLSYATYMFEPFVLAFVLWFVDKRRMGRLTWSFLLLNVMGMVIWLAYPAAPPWYVVEYGLGPARLDALPSAAGAARFDALLGIQYFEGFYGRNVNVFGAMPSLHVADPVLVMCAVWTLGKKWILPAALFALLVAFSAVYLGHHYILDVLAGAVLGVVAYVAVAWLWALRNGRAGTTLQPGRQSAPAD